MKKVVLHLRTSPLLRAQLHAVADDQHRSLNNLACKYLADALQKEVDKDRAKMSPERRRLHEVEVALRNPGMPLPGTPTSKPRERVSYTPPPQPDFNAMSDDEHDAWAREQAAKSRRVRAGMGIVEPPEPELTQAEIDSRQIEALSAELQAQYGFPAIDAVALAMGAVKVGPGQDQGKRVLAAAIAKKMQEQGAG